MLGASVAVLSSPRQSCCAVIDTARCASMAPTWYSRFQSPPRLAAPVASLLAATSAPVSRARFCTKAWPLASSATSQPYNSRSPLEPSAWPQLATARASTARRAASRRVLPISKAPALPCEITWIAARSCWLASARLICATPSSSAASMTISKCRSAPRWRIKPSTSACASGTRLSTKTIS